MSEITWPIKDSDKVLFIIDASHRVERELILQWLAEQYTKDSVPFDPRYVITPISRSHDEIPSNEIERQLSLPEDTLLVPLRVVWQTSVDGKGATPRLRDLLLGNRHLPGSRLAKRILQKHPERVQCIAAKPATLGELREQFDQHSSSVTKDSENFAKFIASRAGLALGVAERKLKGSRYKVPRRVIQDLLASSQLKKAIAELSEETGTSTTDLYQEAQSIMKELVSVPSTFWIDLMGGFQRFFTQLGYESEIVVDQQRLERLRQLTRDHPTAIVFTHKSHVDAMSMSSLFYENDFPVPHMLGGINMAFAGMGYVGRRAGFIFIRRTLRTRRSIKPFFANISVTCLRNASR